MFGFARQQPLHMEVLRAIEVLTYFPCGGEPQTWFAESLDWHKFVFEIDFMHSRDCSFMADLPAADISVYAGLEHLKGNEFACDLDPVTLELFLCRLPWAGPPRAVRPAAASSSRQPRGGQKDDPPWADKAWRKKVAQPAEPEGESSDDEGLENEGIEAWTQEAEEAIWAQVDGLRKDVIDPKWQMGAFIVAVLGGKWTMQHRGVSADAIQAAARGAQAIGWCTACHVPKSARYELATYGAANAALLARTWAAKMTFFYNLATASTELLVSFSLEQKASWPEPSEFTEFARQMSSCPRSSARVQQIRRLFGP